MSKKWSLEPSITLASVLVFPYMVGTWLWLPALKAGKSLASTGIAWSVMSALMTVGLGVIFFEEKLTEPNYAGLVLAIVALVLIQLK